MCFSDPHLKFLIVFFSSDNIVCSLNTKLNSLFIGSSAVQIDEHSGFVANPCTCASKASLQQQPGYFSLLSVSFKFVCLSLVN